MRYQLTLLLTTGFSFSQTARIHAQTVIDGIDGFKWGSSHTEIVGRLGRPREVVTESGFEKIS